MYRRLTGCKNIYVELCFITFLTLSGTKASARSFWSSISRRQSLRLHFIVGRTGKVRVGGALNRVFTFHGCVVLQEVIGSSTSYWSETSPHPSTPRTTPPHLLRSRSVRWFSTTRLNFLVRKSSSGPNRLSCIL